MSYEDEYEGWRGLAWSLWHNWKYAKISLFAPEKKHRFVGLWYTYYDGPHYAIGLWFVNICVSA